MTHERWTRGDAEVTDALRSIYAAPADEGYWDVLETRILARIARGAEERVWWGALVEMTRPGLVAAAALVLAASLAIARSRQLDASSAYVSVISAAPNGVSAPPAASVGDGDVALHYLLSR